MRYLKSLALLIAILVVGSWIFNHYILAATRPYIYTDPHELSDLNYVLVPGASVFRSGKLSPTLRNRVEAALFVHNLKDSIPIIFSGHSIPNGYNEPLAMMDYAKEKGVSQNKISVDPRGVSTYSSIQNFKSSHKNASLLIVSQAYHLPRAVYIARSLGIQCYGLSVQGFNGGKKERTPLREVTSRIKDFILLKFFKLFSTSSP